MTTKDRRDEVKIIDDDITALIDGLRNPPGKRTFKNGALRMRRARRPSEEILAKYEAALREKRARAANQPSPPAAAE